MMLYTPSFPFVLGNLFNISAQLEPAILLYQCTYYYKGALIKLLQYELNTVFMYLQCLPDMTVSLLAHASLFAKILVKFLIISVVTSSIPVLIFACILFSIFSNFMISIFSKLFLSCCISLLIKCIAEFRENCCRSSRSLKIYCSFVDFISKIQIKRLKCFPIAE